VLGSSKPGITGGHKGVRHSRLLQSIGLFGAQVPRGREARLGEYEERSSRQLGFTAVERTSASVEAHTPFAGRCEKPAPQGGAPSSLRRAEQTVRFSHEREEDFRLSRACA
jgi:hypothetical protein